ncbi:NAD-dependent epimerase/dehydratase family protein [Candidatus Micrarchaeota archaeon]|nr:NAD-dependent epimerase/dehydratase family protein [Candidatus Micrarchaeota archaeon]
MNLITGGLGFIGSNIAKELEDVIIVDNLHTGKMDNRDKKIRIEIGNVKNAIQNITDDVENIFHHGIYSSSPMYYEDKHLVSAAVDDFISLLEFARKKDSNVVFASTSSVYNGNEVPFREDMEIKVKDFYSEARYYIERMGRLYNELYGLNVVGLRYFSVYGPREKHKKKYANLLTQIIWKLMDDESPVLYGDGTQARDFIYVSDVVKANLLAIKMKGFGIFNIGTGVETELNKIVEVVNNVLEKRISPSYEPCPIKNYLKKTLADTTKAEKILRFKAEVSLEEGVKKTTEYYKG